MFQLSRSGQIARFGLVALAGLVLVGCGSKASPGDIATPVDDGARVACAERLSEAPSWLTGGTDTESSCLELSGSTSPDVGHSP